MPMPRDGSPRASWNMPLRKRGCSSGRARSTRWPRSTPACATAWTGSRSAWTGSRPEMGSLLRFVRILQVCLRFRLYRFLPGGEGGDARLLREALEALGPIFVKFGQVLSTRRDLLPGDIADELAKLQDQVPPFPSEVAIAEVERAFGKNLGEVYDAFDPVPQASASVAQVHFARLPGGAEVVVKILRPGMLPVIRRDLALLDTAAALV